ncbi:MAG: bifunctional nuclease family protein [Chitinispirillia bacterium]|nr:bifunctional nuclease family protein [Chitinispirillia bacterium]MCL2267793.1 bifunctional nuclease family protein [Chitinispirillia bacterium]
MLVPVEISSFAADTQKGTPLVVLKEISGARSVAVPLDIVEANAIAMHSLQVQVDKPFAIDLVKIAIEQLGGTLYRVVISDASDEGVFSSYIVIQSGLSLKVIDCRPADAVALALKCGAPLFVRDEVFAKRASERGQTEAEQLRERVRAVDTAEFGRYVLE